MFDLWAIKEFFQNNLWEDVYDIRRRICEKTAREGEKRKISENGADWAEIVNTRGEGAHNTD